MKNIFFKILSFLKWSFFFLLLVCLSAYFILRGSLPDLDGHKTMTLLDQSVFVERDEQGIPTIRSKNRTDNAFALGYVHAQERFFQMDLLRRSAAGELSELLGDRAFGKDIQVRKYRFRERARKLLSDLPKQHYTALLAYAQGVNSGIENLSNEPFQYLFLGQKPATWEASDSLLCVYAMYLELNKDRVERETSLSILREQLPQQWFDFLTPQGGQWDAPLDGQNPFESAILAIPELPLPETITKQLTHWNEHIQENFSSPNTLPGSNSWAIDASLTPYSAAMLANDMHLKLQVPNIWYRANWYLNDGRRISGITLPGTPNMVVGTNEHIAWGFTNSYGDGADVITLQSNANKTQYLTSEGWKNFSIHDHSINSSSGSTRNHISIETIWGPVVGKNHKDELIALQWTAFHPQAVNLNLLELENAVSVQEALNIAPTMGLPSQNFVVADDQGHIAWTIAGIMPRRAVRTALGQQRLSGWLSYQNAADYPVLIDPDNHRIWTANNRVISGDKLAGFGFEGDLGARAQQIRDELLAKEQFQEVDLLAIQLDSRARFLARWKQLLSDSVADSNDAALVQMRDVLNKETELAARSDSVAYGLVSAFRMIIVNQTIGWIFDALENNSAGFFKRSPLDNMIEYPVWELVSKKPPHLIPAGYASWDEFISMAARQTYNEITDNGKEFLHLQTWGARNKINIIHPFSKLLPGLNLFLDMPVSPRSGDTNMPKIMSADFGAAMRMVVTPGQEEKGIMHMPAGQSSHPLSAYYSDGHEDWLAGKPSSFLPGKTKWLLELRSIQ